eukprot:TRINITY_DN1346_c0_g1_i1.p2 TRINITY_DN1346_c0_g1~~TRINITY_DN1346_c0_g1_i1.p2  ORF type:complete len:155 (+),score=52.56 TRINITY_DN1346_c0_g1_i1:592-1056(+)
MDAAMKSFDLYGASKIVVELCTVGNTYLQEQQPWTLRDASQKDRRRQILRTALELVYAIGHFMNPFCPSKCDIIFESLGTKPTNLTSLNFDNLTAGTKVQFRGYLIQGFAGGTHDKAEDKKKKAEQARREMQKRKKKKYRLRGRSSETAKAHRG